MTVKELIEQLEEYEPDLPVLVALDEETLAAEAGDVDTAYFVRGDPGSWSYDHLLLDADEPGNIIMCVIVTE